MKKTTFASRRTFGKAALLGSIGGLFASYGRTALSQPLGKQAQWRLCSQCQGLFYQLGAPSVCPAGGPHVNIGGYNYELVYWSENASDAPQSAQLGWRSCSQCQGLFYGESPESRCPAGGSHVNSGSFNYAIDRGGDGTPPPAGAQPYWRWCSKCQGMFYGKSNGGACPASGPHAFGRSYNYFLFHV